MEIAILVGSLLYVVGIVNLIWGMSLKYDVEGTYAVELEKALLGVNTLM